MNKSTSSAGSDHQLLAFSPPAKAGSLGVLVGSGGSAHSNMELLETSVERGYTSSRLSRIRSDRKFAQGSQPPAKVRFNSVSSDIDGMAQAAMDYNLRTVREVP